MHTFDLGIGEFSKVEGKASLKIVVKDDKIEELKFSISEFKRFYTKALKGKDALAIPSLTSRICGTCSNAHLLCAIKALENAFLVKPSDQTIKLRKLLNYGLIIRDHALHLYIFALPDLFGIDNILELDENKENEHQILDDAFAIKAAGNILSKEIGGRSVHAPNLTIGGFTKLPNQNAIPNLITQLENIRPAIFRTIEIFKNCNFKLLQDQEYVAMVSNDFNFLDGEIKTTLGKTILEENYGDYLEHVEIPYSHASGYKLDKRSFMLGAISRLNLAKDKLHPRTKNDAKDALSLFPSKNIYHNNLAQSIEILHAVDSSLDILKNLNIVNEPPVGFVRKEAIGYAAIEAPRGILFYKLVIDSTGKATNVKIIVPTGANQLGIERSIYDFISRNLDNEKDYLIKQIEQIVRAYDPCLSCASHFLKVSFRTKSS